MENQARTIVTLGTGEFDVSFGGCIVPAGERNFIVPTLLFNVREDGDIAKDFEVTDSTIFVPFENTRDIERLIVRSRGLVEGCEIELLNNVTLKLAKQDVVPVLTKILEDLVKYAYSEDLPKPLNEEEES